MRHDPDEGRIGVERRGAVLTIRLERAAKRNALTLAMKRSLTATVRAADRDDEVRVIVLTGSDTCFAAGTDVAEMEHMTPADHDTGRTGEVFEVLGACETPLLAAVEGHALGGGFELALCCDVIVAGQSAQFGLPEASVGVMPGGGGSVRLATTVGAYEATRIALLGQRLSAARAHHLGLVAELVADGSALKRATEIAEDVASLPVSAVRLVKKSITMAAAPAQPLLFFERRAFVSLFGTAHQREGMRAVLERRPPDFRPSRGAEQ